jgi:hypothetical protein
MPRTRYCSIQARHLRETLNHAARRNHRHDRAVFSRTANETGQQAEPSCVDVIHA